MTKKWIEVCLNILFWCFSSWIIIYSFSITEHFVDISNGFVTENTIHDDNLIVFFSIGQPIFAFYFYLQCFFTQQLTDKSKLKSIITKLLFTLVIFIITCNLIVRVFFLNFVHIVLFPSLWYGIFIFYTIVAIAYGLIKAWSKMENDKRNLELIKNQTELNLLRKQLHPHFLFNTMNNLLSMVDQVNNPKLALSIDKLSGLLRYVVYENKNSLVSISNEIEFIQNFSELHLLRYDDDEIDFKVNIDGINNNQLIERGILLSLVENAFKHGVQPEFNSFIHIKINITEVSKIVFSIKNSIPPRLAHAIENIGGYGLKSTKEHLQLAYPNKHSLEIKESKNEFEVTLTIITDESHNS